MFLRQIRGEETSCRCPPPQLNIRAIARSACNTRKSYIVVGGLGGFGFELCQWLVCRGARHLIMTSRTGVLTGYQRSVVREWRAIGVEVNVSTRNVVDAADADALVDEVSERAEIAGVFNLAMVLDDGLMPNQTPERFARVAAPKVAGTKNLDAATRRVCGATLEWFVVFSSMSCGRGNAGQANYGYANSVMERICEQRQRDGLAGMRCSVRHFVHDAVQQTANHSVHLLFNTLYAIPFTTLHTTQ